MPDKKLPLSYDYCGVFPTACASPLYPYVQSVTYTDGFSESEYLILRRENTKLITLHGHSLDLRLEPYCVFGDVATTPATLIDEFEIECTTPTFTEILAPLRVGLFYKGDYQVWPDYPSSLRMIEMPMITAIQKKQHVIVSESVLPF